jgi:ABC-type multidrug transport system fused ATPase/permease subunit
LIDGTEISTVSRTSLRNHLAFVGQDAFLFRGSIRENIALGSADATEADVAFSRSVDLPEAGDMPRGPKSFG